MRTALVVTEDVHVRWRIMDVLKLQLGYAQCTVVGRLDEIDGRADFACLVVDLAAPDVDDEVAWGVLRFRYPAVPLVVVLNGPDERALRLAFVAGAAGFLDRACHHGELADSLRQVLSGIRVLPQGRSFPWDQGVSGGGATSTAMLTRREGDVLRLIAEGCSNSEIAGRLHVSRKTVKNHITNILGKLHLQNRTQAALWAREHGVSRPRWPFVTDLFPGRSPVDQRNDSAIRTRSARSRLKPDADTT